MVLRVSTVWLKANSESLSGLLFWFCRVLSLLPVKWGFSNICCFRALRQFRVLNNWATFCRSFWGEVWFLCLWTHLSQLYQNLILLFLFLNNIGCLARFSLFFLFLFFKYYQVFVLRGFSIGLRLLYLFAASLLVWRFHLQVFSFLSVSFLNIIKFLDCLLRVLHCGFFIACSLLHGSLLRVLYCGFFTLRVLYCVVLYCGFSIASSSLRGSVSKSWLLCNFQALP